MYFLVANSYGFPVSSTQVATMTMVGAAAASSMFGHLARTRVNWFPTMTVVVLVWLFMPFIAMALSALTYQIVKKSVLESKSKFRALQVTPYISGAVFMIYFAFIFSTQYFSEISSFGVQA
jgi:phosphate/sulfate permease